MHVHYHAPLPWKVNGVAAHDRGVLFRSRSDETLSEYHNKRHKAARETRQGAMNKIKQMAAAKNKKKSRREGGEGKVEEEGEEEKEVEQPENRININDEITNQVSPETAYKSKRYGGETHRAQYFGFFSSADIINGRSSVQEKTWDIWNGNSEHVIISGVDLAVLGFGDCLLRPYELRSKTI